MVQTCSSSAELGCLPCDVQLQHACWDASCVVVGVDSTLQWLFDHMHVLTVVSDKSVSNPGAYARRIGTVLYHRVSAPWMKNTVQMWPTVVKSWYARCVPDQPSCQLLAPWHVAVSETARTVSVWGKYC